MEVTAISTTFFALVKLVLWLGVVAWAIALGRKLWREADPKPSADADGGIDEVVTVTWPDVWWNNRLNVAAWAIAFFAAIFFTQLEPAYRPKTVIQPNNAVLEQQLRELDRMPAPEIGPAEGDLRDAANAGYAEQNLEENEAARERFLSIPEGN